MTRRRWLAWGVWCGFVLQPLAANARDLEKEPTISVTGEGRVALTPDLAEINVGVRSQAATATEALEKNTMLMGEIHVILKQRGVEGKDVETTQLQVSPRYSQPLQRPMVETDREFVPKLIGYQVDNQVQVTARKLGELGSLLDALVKGGANQINGIAFRVDHPERSLDDARREAIRDARRKAELFVKETGGGVGMPLRIEEQAIANPTPPRMMRSYAVAAPMSVPIAQGEQEFKVTVHVVYQLVPFAAK